MITNTNLIVHMLVCKYVAKQVPDIVALHFLVNKCLRTGLRTVPEKHK